MPRTNLALRRPSRKPLSRSGKATTRPKGAAATPSGTKLDRLISLLSRAKGASIADMMEVTGWQAHSVRGALAGALQKRGLNIASDKTDGERRYRIVANAS